MPVPCQDLEFYLQYVMVFLKFVFSGMIWGESWNTIKNISVSPYPTHNFGSGKVGKLFFYDDKDVLGNAKISIFWWNESKKRNFQQNKFWAKRKKRRQISNKKISVGRFWQGRSGKGKQTYF